MKRIVKQLSRRNWRPAATAVTLLAALLISIPPAPAQTLTTIYSFKGSPDGATPGSVSGQGGVLYGTTNGGGTSGFGTAFSLTPPASSGGAWTETVLYDFGGGSDGINPNVGLAIGKDGSVCGTTAGGGTSNNGTVFCLTPPASSGGSWTEKVLHRFAGSPGDGARPFAGLWRTGGVIYGTTGFGGTTDSGTVFSLTPAASAGGAWTETVLYNLLGSPGDGQSPQARVVMDSGGALYGTTAGGGISNNGTVFCLTPPASSGGAWTETVLYFFKGGSDGRDPLGSVLIGSGGVLYGTTRYGGTTDSGTVFSLTPPASAGGAWTETVLYSFGGHRYYGGPFAGVVMGKGGVLYGSNCCGGTSSNGTVFSLTPPAASSGAWTERVLHSFSGGDDGASPQASVVIGKDGLLYSTTTAAGLLGHGTVFSVKP
jgi:uncharacterized repeat protein (TIGR03803 family)